MINVGTNGFIPIPYEEGKAPISKKPVLKSEIQKAERNQKEMEYFKKVLTKTDFVNKKIGKDVVCKKINPESAIESAGKISSFDSSKIMFNILKNFARGVEGMFGALNVKI